jgi:hypothetical protein
MPVKPLYVQRPVLNHDEIVSWALPHGIRILFPESLHVTLCYSRTPMAWPKPNAEVLLIHPRQWDHTQWLEKFGPQTLVLRFECAFLNARHEFFRSIGASHDFPRFQSHVTLSDCYDGDAPMVPPFREPLLLGPEVFAELDENWTPEVTA